MGEAARVALVALGEFVLLACFLVPVPGDDAGIAGALVGQAGDIVAVRQLRFQLQGRGEGVGGEAVADVAAEPDDGGDFRFDAGEAVGLVGYVKDRRKAMRDSKGPGNFRNLFMYAPNGKKDGIQLIPISEVAAKDDFGAIKNISRDDQLAMLRIPPQLVGVVPQNAGGFGSIREAAQVWAVNEL